MSDITDPAEIFKEAEQIAKGGIVQPVIAQPQQSTETGYSYTSVELPSKGRLGYPDHVEYRDIMLRDEKSIASATESTFFITLNNVLKSLLKDDSFYLDMSIADRDFLIMWIWSNSYDTVKHIESECAHCGASNEYKVDITELEIKELDERYNPKYVHKFKSGKKLPLRLATVADEAAAFKYAKANRDVDEAYVLSIMTVTDNVAGNIESKLRWAEENLTGKDMMEIRGFHAFFNYGIEDSVIRACKECGEDNKILIPFQINDFLPTNTDDFELTI